MRGHSVRAALLALALSLALALPALAYDDTAGHWGAEAIDRWSGEEILQGYGGQFRPDAPITRGELAVILDRLMDYQTLSDAAYPDVEADSWYEEAVLGAAQANILQGDGTSLRPLDPITRQEAAVLLGRALGVAENAAGLEGFTDAGEAASWAAGYLGGMAQAGILSGYQGRIMPAATITRAEVAQLLDNAVAARYDEAGSYTTDADGNVIVSAPGVTLSDMTIKGNLIAAEGIGDGDLILDNVTLEGELVVRGGGEHSIIIKGNSSVSTITAQRRDGGVRLSVEDDASVEIITINDGSDAVIVAGTVGTLHVDGAQAQVTVAGTVETVAVAEQAEGASVTVSGGAKVGSLTAAAPDTAITVGKGGTVESVTADGAGTTVTGSGKVNNVTANADNVAVSTPNTKVEASEGTSGVTAGDKNVSGGSSATTPGTSTGGSSSGGGGSSVTYYTVTYRFLDEVLGTEQVASGGHPTGSGITVPDWVGYDFSGWRVEDGWPPVELSDVTVTGNVTLYARLCAMPAEPVSVTNDGITIRDTDPDTYLNLVSGNIPTVDEDGNYVLTVQMKAPERVQYNPDDNVLQLSHILDGEVASVEEYTYGQAFGQDGVFTYDYPVAPEGATSSNKILELYVKWHGFDNTDPCLGGWATDLDMSGLTLGNNSAQTVATINGVGYATLEEAVAAIPADAEGGDLYLVNDYTLTEDITIPGGWTLNINEDITLTIPEQVTLTISQGATLNNLYAILNRGTINGGGTLHNGNTIWNRGTIDCTVVNYQPVDSDWAVEYYQYAQWNGEGWTLASLPHMANEIDCSIFAAFNFTEDLNGSDTALAKAIDRINDIPESAGYTFHLLEVRCQLTVNTPLTLPANTSLALMGGENRGITIENGGSIRNGNVEIITFEGYPVAQLTVKNGAALTGELYITGNVNDCLVVEDGATVQCRLFQRNTQMEEYRPIS